MTNRLTHKVLRETAPGAAVHEHATVTVHVRHVHGRALHLWVREPHLQVQVVHVLEKLAKVPAGGPDGRVVAQVAEEPHETPAEVPHEVVRGGRLVVAAAVAAAVAVVVRRHGEQLRGRDRQPRHQLVRVYVVRVELGPLAPGQADHVAPRVLAELQLWPGHTNTSRRLVISTFARPSRGL